MKIVLGDHGGRRFIRDNKIKYEWIGMNGHVGECKEDHVCRSQHEKVALRLFKT